MNRPFSTALLDAPPRVSKEWHENQYSEERKAIKEDLKDLNVHDVDEPVVRGKLKAIANKIITKTIDQMPTADLTDIILPRVDGVIGNVIEQQEIEGLQIYESTYGAAVRMSQPMFKPYTITTNPKEMGVRIILADLQSGKYSTSQVGEYAGMLIGAFRTRLVFRTLEANASFASGGSQYQAGTGLNVGTLISAIGKLSDEGDIKVIVGRRAGIIGLSKSTAFSNDTRREFETKGQVGTFAGIPVMKVNSFTDLTYGTVYPFASNVLWIFCEAPAGRFMVVQDVQAATELIARDGAMNIYYRWDDGCAIWKPNRAAVIAAIT